uniref:(northern house mosquito) hypothetical protein n=1 Tax=Culex pipiens TaxID=7175 RepID=A0A8D8CNU6_CULPI
MFRFMFDFRRILGFELTPRRTFVVRIQQPPRIVFSTFPKSRAADPPRGRANTKGHRLGTGFPPSGFVPGIQTGLVRFRSRSTRNHQLFGVLPFCDWVCGSFSRSMPRGHGL